MQLTVEDVMKFETLLDAKVRTATDFLGARTVEWVSVTETPVENFVRKNELVLTTGIGCANDMDSFEQFVCDVIESEASALAIATGRYIFDIPPEIVCLAEKHQLPIIEIPWEVRFADISHEVMQELTKRQQNQYKVSENVQQQLLSMILRGENLTKVAKYVAKQLDYQVVITDSKGMIKGSSQTNRSFFESWNEKVAQHIVPAPKNGEDTDTHHPLHTKIKKIVEERETLIQLPIFQEQQRIQGYLFVVSVNQSPRLTNTVVNVLEHAVTASALWFLRENAIEETEMRLRDDFVWSLTKDVFDSIEKVRERARLLGYVLESKYVCIVGSPENLTELFEKRKQSSSSYEQWESSMIHYIKEEIMYAGESLHKKTMVTYQSEQLVIFLEVSDQPEETVNHFLDLLDRRMKHLLPEVVLTWGIGRLHKETKLFHGSYIDAKLALDIGRTQKGIGSRVHFLDTKMERALLSLATNEEICEIAQQTIEPLVEYEETRHMELIETIATFNENQCNVSKTARALSLHRQSLLYRLRKIESLTGLSLVDPDHMFLLNLSMKLWALQQVKKEK
ncbi:PucR family transcriptional regulator [Bacillus alkalicellulosilyticus]|uniref:PucR family transcriptional regulator n=1 Tax=Alkalihalobacterium alkalicellulosilyticum TaxID=1912214 RepID=UPI0009983A75|nr:PucR family transcriptional regulator [Bacillus alkalicellulosilyticus]